MKLSFSPNILLLLYLSLSAVATSEKDANGKTREDQLRRRTAVSHPNIKDSSYSYNALLRKPPAKQRKALQGIRMFTFTGETGMSSNLIQHDQVNDIYTGEGCEYQAVSSGVYWATSSESLSEQTSSSSNGFDQSINLGVSVPVKGAEVSAETTICSALVFGNSVSSSRAKTNKDAGYTYSFHGFSKRSMYAVELDYNNINSWTSKFMSACSALGPSPSFSQVAAFFRDIGTHGLVTAGFGQLCLVDAFMEGGSSFHGYEEHRASTASMGAAFRWWSSSSASSQSQFTSSNLSYGFTYSYDNRRCEGQLQSASACSGGMPTGNSDSPIVVKWTYKPIWRMNIPGLSSGAKSKMEEYFSDILDAAADCSINSCNGHGACAPSGFCWSSYGDITAASSLFDTSRCYCDDDWIGDRCDKGRPVEVENPVISSNWLNSFHEHVNIQYLEQNQPLCGMFSVHADWAEDRIFKAYTCAIAKSPHNQRVATQTTFESFWHIPFTILCDQDKMMTKLVSDYYNHVEDRHWRATCSRFQDTKIDYNTCEGFDPNSLSLNGYVNRYDQQVDFQCSRGKVLVGVHVVHDQGKGDRRFSFRCCTMITDIGNSYLLQKTDWMSYVNWWDGYMDTGAFVDGQKGYFCGFSWYFDGGRNDRGFRFKFCKPPSSSRSNWTSKKVENTPYDGRSMIDCPSGSGVGHIRSSHDDGREDRTWSYWCYAHEGWTTDSCYWTDYVNWWGQPNEVETRDQHIIASIDSHHWNGGEDCRFRFKFCHMIPS